MQYIHREKTTKNKVTIDTYSNLRFVNSITDNVRKPIIATLPNILDKNVVKNRLFKDFLPLKKFALPIFFIYSFLALFTENNVTKPVVKPNQNTHPTNITAVLDNREAIGIKSILKDIIEKQATEKRNVFSICLDLFIKSPHRYG